MLRPQRLFRDVDGALVERFRLGIAGEHAIDLGKIVEIQPKLGMIRSKDLLADGDRAQQQRLRFGVAAELVMNQGEIADQQREGRVLGARAFSMMPMARL